MTDKNKEIFRHIDVYIEYSNAVVPNFDVRGKPDLLAWDQAMESHQPNKEPLARIYKKDIAELCEEAIYEHFEGVDLNEVFESDHVTIEFDEVYDTEDDGPTLKWNWADIVQEAYCYENNLSQVDYYGKDFEWGDEEKLHKQVPPISDFIHFIEEEASDHVRYYEKGNSNDYFPLKCRLDNLRKMMELAEKLYGDNWYD